MASRTRPALSPTRVEGGSSVRSRRVTGRSVTGAWLWIVATVAYFFVEIAAALAWNGRYDWMQNSISDLGWRQPGWVEYPFQSMWADSPLSWLFNGGSVVVGCLMILGSWELRSMWTPGRFPKLARWITAAWIFMGIGTVLTALVPGDMSLLWHSILAQPIFVCAPALAAMLSLQIRPVHHHLAITAAVVAVVSLIGTAGLLVQLWVRIPFGLMERMALDTIFVWMFVAGITEVLSSHRRTR